MVASGMSQSLACDLRESVALKHEALHAADKPVLSVEEDFKDDPETIEKRFEIQFSGEAPSCIVGIEIEAIRGFVDRDGPWKTVLQHIAMIAAERRVLTTRTLHDYAKSLARHEYMLPSNSARLRKKPRASL